MTSRNTATTTSEADTHLLASALLGIKSDLAPRAALPTLPPATVPRQTNTNTTNNNSRHPQQPQTAYHSLASNLSLILSSSSLIAAAAATASCTPAATTAVNNTASTASTFTTSNNNNTNDSIEAAATTSNSAVREDQVQAALHSKPQRGRKRDNLTAQERLELTRTRNREHARSTRHRKKARYQELEAKEQELTRLQVAAELETARRATVEAFVRLRQCMIRRLATSPTLSPLPPDAGVDQIVHDLDQFLFVLAGAPEAEARGLQGMGRFDETLLHRTRDMHGADAVDDRQLTYQHDAIALSQQDTGMVPVTITLVDDNSDDTTKEGQVLVKATLLLRFLPSSAKLASVEWQTFHDALVMAAAAAEPPIKPQRQRGLDSQKVFPSVVSFDRTLEYHSKHDPGMTL